MIEIMGQMPQLAINTRKMLHKHEIRISEQTCLWRNVVGNEKN